MKITIVGTGYVGMSLAVLFSQKHEVTAIDIDKNKIDKINDRISPIKDNLISKYLLNKNLNLVATLNYEMAYKKADYIIICTPTNYNAYKKSFDVSTVEKVIKKIIKLNSKCYIIIKSTIPVGYTLSIRNKFKKKDIYFSPEFLREGLALYDNLHPSRIIIGGNSKKAKLFGELLFDFVSAKRKKLVSVETMGSSEAEAVKLFSNTYLAMRISYFNELDSYCESNNLRTEDVIRGIGHDPRIGNFYNNPSFGYGGYCLPKDTKQLLKNYKDVPNKIIKAIVDSNTTRKEFIAKRIIAKKPKTVGIYRLVMKLESDNFKESAILEIIKIILNKNIEVIIFEPQIHEDKFMGLSVIKDLKKFFSMSELIVANRNSKELATVKNKLYTRDIFNKN